MVVSGNDQLESFFNSVQVVKNAFSPIESNFRKVAKNFKHCFNVFVKKGNLIGAASDTNVEQVSARLHVKKSGGSVVINGVTDGYDPKKEKVPINIFVGIFAENFDFSLDEVEKMKVNLSKQQLNERYGSDSGANKVGNLNRKHLHFELALSFLINGFVQAFLSQLKADKKVVQKNNGDNICDDSHLRLEVKQRVVGEIKPKELKVNVGKDLPFECLIGFVYNQFSNFPNFDVGVQDHECKSTDCKALTPFVNKVDHFKALTGILGCRKADVHGFLRNLKFARVGGVPSCTVGVPSVKDVEEESISNTLNQEEGGGGPRHSSSKAANVVAVPPPVEIAAGDVLKSALAGGISCALSASLMHPVDTIKTWLQASTVTSPEIMSMLRQLGVRGLYRGSIPAIVGQFSSHGLRTGICEASKLVLVNVAPTLPDIQVQSAASFCSTFIGTAMRIPCEVLKQRLQAGLFDNVGEAIVGTWQQDGLKGFFRGTGATLCREIPFYVAGMGLYAQSKKAAQKLLRRELEPWETIVVGAVSGGLTAVLTTPLDVIKTRMMIAPQGQPMTLSIIALSILCNEGPLGLFKGAVPRFFWVAPLGAMNFAGYELIRKAMD